MRDDISRREFLSKCASVAGGGAAGLAAIHALGLGAVEDARAWGILPAVVGTGAGAGGGGGGHGTSWATWDGDEGGWGDEDNNHVMRVAGGAGDDETAQGIVTGADLVWTDNGGIPATSGGKRFVDSNASDYFTGTQTLLDTVCSDNTWTFLFHLNTVAGPPSADGYWIYLSGGNYLYLGYMSSGNLLLQSDMGGAFIINTANTILPTMDADCWLGCWSDGTYMKCGFTETGSGAIGQPTKLSDFVGTDVATRTQNSGATGGFNTNKYIFIYPGRNPMSAYIYRGVFSKLCLVNNSL